MEVQMTPPAPAVPFNTVSDYRWSITAKLVIMLGTTLPWLLASGVAEEMPAFTTALGGQTPLFWLTGLPEVEGIRIASTFLPMLWFLLLRAPSSVTPQWMKTRCTG